MNLWQQLQGVAAPTPPERRGAAAMYHGARIGIAVALAILTYLLFPASPAVEFPVYEVGAVASENVIAPFGFAVKKTPAQLDRERADIARSVNPVFVYVPAAYDSSRREIEAFGGALGGVSGTGAQAAAAIGRAAAPFRVVLTPEEATYLARANERAALLGAVGRAYNRWLREGVTSGGALDEVRGAITIRRGDEERQYGADTIQTFNTFLSRARFLDPNPESDIGSALYTKLLTAFFHPTLVRDDVATEKAREDLRKTVSENRYEVRAFEKIIGANEVVGREEHEKLRALQEELQTRRAAGQVGTRVLGAVLFNFLVIAIVGVALVLFRPQLYQSLRAVTTFAGVYLLVLISASIIAHSTVIPSELTPLLVPIALAGVTLSVLFDPRISMIATMVLAVLIGGQSVFRGTNALFFMLIAGAAAAFSMRVIRRRREVYSSILTIAGAYVLSSIALGLTLDWSANDLVRSVLFGVLNAALTVPIAMFLLPLAEQLTGIETDLTLLEWSDLNRPLMRRLSLEAPGTYAHTMAMANLAEAASNSIGANGLLARVGAYYHDIGKLKKPQYFVENQPKGRNPHDKLKPVTSAAIIRGHVREGLELAEEYKLPKAVRAFITEHHGTGSIAYFLEKARERDGSAPPNMAEFQYPGPMPQSAETAICMLADGVEAATRVLSEPTPQKIRDVVEHIVRQRMEQGQLRSAPLTLRQLDVVKEQFARVLIGQYHNRIDYPAASGGVTSEFAPV